VSVALETDPSKSVALVMVTDPFVVGELQDPGEVPQSYIVITGFTVHVKVAAAPSIFSTVPGFTTLKTPMNAPTGRLETCPVVE
jgi:hypothetical protein